MRTDVHALPFRRDTVAQPCVMNVILPNNKGVTVAAIHREGVVSGPADFALFKCEMMSPDESHPRTTASKVDAPNGHV